MLIATSEQDEEDNEHKKAEQDEEDNEHKKRTRFTTEDTQPILSVTPFPAALEDIPAEDWCRT